MQPEHSAMRGDVVSLPAPGAMSMLAALAQARWAIPIALGLLTFLVFTPSIWNDFVEWDDHVNLTWNEHFRGLGWSQLRWMSTTILMGHYIPVTWLSLGLDYVLWGMDPRGYHLTNVVLHAANAAVFYLVALRILGRTLDVARPWLPLCAGVAALFFAVHPLRAESVAWVTERRDVLSGFFTLATVLLYLHAAEADSRRRIRLLAGAAGAYLLALGAKSIVMTLPLVLVLLDVYPLRRIPASWHHWGDAGLRDVWREKIPFFALAGLGAIVSWYAVAANDFFTPGEKYPLVSRIAIAFYSLGFYIRKTLFPVGLTPLYELPLRVDPLAPRFLFAIIVVVLVGLTLLAARRRWPAGLAAAAYYAVTLAPVSGLVHAGHQLAHDRYSYLSCLGVALLIGAAPAGILTLRQRHTVSAGLARMALAGIALWLATLAFLTVHQVQIWRDTETLWRYAVDADDRCSVCHHNLGGALLVRRDLPREAIPHLERALELRPDRVRVNTTLGAAYARVGDDARAIEHFEREVRSRPDSPDPFVHHALVLMKSGRDHEAHTVLRRARLIHRDDPMIRVNLSAVLARLGATAEALEHARHAVHVAPGAPQARHALGRALLALGQYDDAREQYDVLMSMDEGAAQPLALDLGARLVTEW